MRINSDNQFQLFLEYADGGELFDRIGNFYFFIKILIYFT